MILGWQRWYWHPRTGQRSASLRESYACCSGAERELSGEFFARYLAGRGTGDLTPFAGILQEPGPLRDVAPDAGGADLRQCLTDALDESLPGAGDSDLAVSGGIDMAMSGHVDLAMMCGVDLAEGGHVDLATSGHVDLAVSGHVDLAVSGHVDLAVSGHVDLAVSGGIDCWLLAALLRSRGYRVRAWYLESGVPGYCERQQVQSMAEALDIPCRYVRVTAADFVESLEEFLSVVETPIYNLHPVSKWLLAQRLRKEGVATLVTGDGADQVMRREWDCDLLPLTLACFQHAGIRLVLPFTDHRVIAFCREPFPDKRPVRELARELGVPDAAKHATLFPPVSLPGIKPSGNDRVDCLSYTTGLLVRVLEEHRQCAGSRA